MPKLKPKSSRAAKKAKNFQESDRIRNELKALGITLVDQKNELHGTDRDGEPVDADQLLCVQDCLAITPYEYLSECLPAT